MSPLLEAAHDALREAERRRAGATLDIPCGAGASGRSATTTVRRQPPTGRSSHGVIVAAQTSRYFGAVLVPVAATTWLYNLTLLMR